jgi:hypothetical protein
VKYESRTGCFIKFGSTKFSPFVQCMKVRIILCIKCINLATFSRSRASSVGSIILAIIVLKLSLYGIWSRLTNFTDIIGEARLLRLYLHSLLIGVITIIYASFSTLRTVQ